MTAMRLFDYGPDAVLAELLSGSAVPPVREAALALPGVLEAVAGAQTVLVEFDLALTSPAAIRAGLLSTPPIEAPSGAVTEVVVAVRYDGADLADVATRLSLPRDEVITIHCAPTYTVRFCGFAPGFAYLDGLDPLLRMPRHPTPRAAVPAGAVAVAGEFAAIYPRTSPGGWQLLGQTDLALWDSGARVPALLTPGTRVRFEPT